MNEIGKAMQAKLSRSNWQIMRYIAPLCVSYGADIKPIPPKTKKHKGELIIWLQIIEAAKKIFCPSRFDGSNYLRRWRI